MQGDDSLGYYLLLHDPCLSSVERIGHIGLMLAGHGQILNGNGQMLVA